MHSDQKSTTALPSRVQAALDFLSYCHWVTQQCDPAVAARTLSPVEIGVQQAALRVLRLYFDGEMDFGDAPPHRPGPSDEGPGPGSPVVAPV